MKEVIVKQTEDFEVHEQVIDNLMKNEKILFKLKVVKSPKLVKNRKTITLLFIALTILTPFINIAINISKDEEPADFITLFTTIGLISITILWSLFSRSLRAPTEFHFFITNKRVFLLDETNPGIDIDIIDLEAIQCISSKQGKRNLEESEGIEIELISLKFFNQSKASDRIRYKLPIRNDLIRVRRAIESILWHYGNVNQKLVELKEELGFQKSSKIIDSRKDSQVEIFNNKISFLSRKSSQEIKFSENLYLNYKRHSGNSGFIIIHPSVESPIRFKFRIKNSNSRLLEFIYFMWLSWKFNNQLLTDVSKF